MAKPIFIPARAGAHAHVKNLIVAKILICEDEILLATELAESFKNLGYQIAGRVASAEEAIRLAEDPKPNLVLMDIKLDGKKDGIEAADEIRERLDIPVSYIRGYSEEDVLERAKKTEPYGYLSKPVGLLELRSTVQTVLYKHEANKKVKESEQLLKKILEILPVGVWITDKDWTIVHGNPAGQKIWEGAKYVGPEEFGQYLAWWAETGKRIEAEEWAVSRAIHRGETSIEEEIEIQCFDGTHKTILNWAILMFDIKGEVEGAIAVN